MTELIIASGTMKGQRLILPDREVIVGRDEECHMRIASSLISRKHCAIKGTLNGVWVRDLESQNGTYVNDVAIKDPYLMKPGDMLRVGAALFQVPRSKAVPRPEKTPGGLSDQEISTWLADDEQTATSGLPDTTVIKGRPAANPTTADPASADPAVPAPRVAAPAAEPRAAEQRPESRTIRQPPKTVKEQAAEIIRRHWEIVRGQPNE